MYSMRTTYMGTSMAALVLNPKPEEMPLPIFRLCHYPIHNFVNVKYNSFRRWHYAAVFAHISPCASFVWLFVCAMRARYSADYIYYHSQARARLFLGDAVRAVRRVLPLLVTNGPLPPAAAEHRFFLCAHVGQADCADGSLGRKCTRQHTMRAHSMHKQITHHCAASRECE